LEAHTPDRDHKGRYYAGVSRFVNGFAGKWYTYFPTTGPSPERESAHTTDHLVFSALRKPGQPK